MTRVHQLFSTTLLTTVFLWTPSAHADKDMALVTAAEKASQR